MAYRFKVGQQFKNTSLSCSHIIRTVTKFRGKKGKRIFFKVDEFIHESPQHERHIVREENYHIYRDFEGNEYIKLWEYKGDTACIYADVYEK